MAAIIAFSPISPARAADSWVVTDVHGAVLALVGDQWLEVSRGDMIGDGTALRTLQAGSVKLRLGSEEIGLDANTVVRPSSANGRLTVEQYAGVVTLAGTGRTASRLVTPSYVAVGSQGSLVSRLTSPAATLYVRSGEVRVSAGGRRMLLQAGQAYSAPGTGDGSIISPAAGASSPGAAAITPQGPATSDEPASSDNGVGDGGTPGNAGQTGVASSPDGSSGSDNGVGNGGTPGNGGQNGNAGGNGNAGSKGKN